MSRPVPPKLDDWGQEAVQPRLQQAVVTAHRRLAGQASRALWLCFMLASFGRAFTVPWFYRQVGVAGGTGGVSGVALAFWTFSLLFQAFLAWLVWRVWRWRAGRFSLAGEVAASSAQFADLREALIRSVDQHIKGFFLAFTLPVFFSLGPVTVALTGPWLRGMALGAVAPLGAALMVTFYVVWPVVAHTHLLRRESRWLAQMVR